jgi:hypothetical protein
MLGKVDRMGLIGRPCTKACFRYLSLGDHPLDAVIEPVGARCRGEGIDAQEVVLSALLGPVGGVGGVNAGRGAEARGMR